MFEQMQYNESGYKLELKDIENVDGINCYKLIITDPGGESFTEFYDVKTNYLLRSVKSQSGDKVSQLLSPPITKIIKMYPVL